MLRSRRGRQWSVVATGVIALVALTPTQVAAECMFVPPWPRITSAIPSAPDVVVGDIVDDVDPADLASGDGDREALRVTVVLRGDYQVGDLIGTDYLLPNWPWQMAGDGSQAYPSCSNLQALPGERIALALDALMPGQQLRDSNNATWYQPPTRYNAIGVLRALEPSEGWGEERERVTLGELRRLVDLPQTDVLSPGSPPDGWSQLPLAVLAGVISFLVFLTRPTRDIRPR